jgi:hypothetical protein
MSEDNLLMVEFETVEDAINFIPDYWNGFKDAPRVMRETDKELDEDKRWLFIMGCCDICNAEHQFFIPACAFEDGIVGSECGKCGNMSVYPRGLETEYEID